MKFTPELMHMSAIVLLSVVFTSAAILLVYVLLGTRVEKRVVQRQTKFVVDSLLSDTTVFGGDAQLALKTYLGTIKVPDMSSEDAAAAMSNKNLLRKACILIALSCVVAVVVSMKLTNRIQNAFEEAMLSAVFAAVTEAAFLLCIGQWYISADPNQVKSMVLQKIIG